MDTPELGQEIEILHVPGSHLKDVGIFPDELDILGAHHLGDNGQARLFLGQGEKLQPFFLQALEGVRAGARLEGTASQHIRAGIFYCQSGLEDLFFAFHGAGPGDNDRAFAFTDLMPSHLDDRAAGWKSRETSL